MTPATASLRHRIANADDVPAIVGLMEASIEVNMADFLSAAEIEAARESMGVDRTLIDDGTYFLIESETDGERVLAGCGGWGRRRTLFGGQHTTGRDDRFSDPATEPARIRAMYTHPRWTRRGIGSLLLDLGEGAAREAGFRHIELASTIPGEPFYLARGYRELSRMTRVGENGVVSVLIHMRKTL